MLLGLRVSMVANTTDVVCSLNLVRRTPTWGDGKCWINRRPVKRPHMGTLYFKRFFLTVVTYIWYSGKEFDELITGPRLSEFKSRGPLKISCRPNLI